MSGFNSWRSLTHDFPVSVLSSWHPSCSLYIYVIYCCHILPPCMLRLAGCAWLLRFAGSNAEVVEVTGEDISVSTEGKKMCVGFKRSMALFLLDESLTSCGSLLGM